MVEFYCRLSTIVIEEFEDCPISCSTPKDYTANRETSQRTRKLLSEHLARNFRSLALDLV